MTTLRVLLRQVVPILTVVFSFGAGLAYAQQEESAKVTKYREDYEKYQTIAAISDPMKRADQIIQFVKDRPDPKLVQTAQANLFQVLDSLMKSENNEPLLSLSERYIKVRPNVGETYYCWGFALKNLKRPDEAMDALAKCYILQNPLSTKAKDFLDLIYKGQHRGSLAGIEQVINKARREVAKIQE